MIDWPGAESLLFRISTEPLAHFLKGPDKEDVYGIGFYCDALYGYVHLVANTEQFHREKLLEYEASFRDATPERIALCPPVFDLDPEVFRWDIGSWKYPGGLFGSMSAEQRSFDRAWEKYQNALSQLGHDENIEAVDENQELLKEICRNVLVRMFNERILSALPRLEGLTVLGPDDPRQFGLEMKRSIASLLDI